MISLIELEATLLPFLPGTSWASHSMVRAVQMNDPRPIYLLGLVERPEEPNSANHLLLLPRQGDVAQLEEHRLCKLAELNAVLEAISPARREPESNCYLLLGRYRSTWIGGCPRLMPAERSSRKEPFTIPATLGLWL